MSIVCVSAKLPKRADRQQGITTGLALFANFDLQIKPLTPPGVSWINTAAGGDGAYH